MMASPFFDVPQSDWLAQNRSGFVIADKYPVSPGHSLVVPRRLVSTWWEASAEERVDLLDLVDEVRRMLDERHAPDGYNVGVNIGAAAGQTVDHLHLHVIPRYVGDVADPRGGLRHVIPGRGNYLLPESERAPLVDGIDRDMRFELLRAIINPELTHIDLIVSFVMRSGIDVIDRHLDDALERGARVRILTTDYLDITDPDALARLLDLHEIHGEHIQTRLFSDPGTSFHPKAYIFRTGGDRFTQAFVGSSNLSGSGLSGGIEWNVVVDNVAPLLRSFERMWTDPRTVPLDHHWLSNYRRTRRRPDAPPGVAEIPTIGVAPEPVRQPVEPRETQRRALAALEDTRDAGHGAGLVVMATGLGKTWVAAFDTARPEFRRVLFVAHREEILRQSLEAFRQVRTSAELGLFTGTDKQRDADVVFASVQTLTNRLHEFEPDEFDYVVIDEFHHAAARTYRRVIDHFEPTFLLGLTATPERLDGADLLSLCGDNLVFECNLVEGINRKELVPFRYVGIADTVDFEPIPWRSGRFDTEALRQAVETQERAAHAFEEWQHRGGERTLAFCVTTTHADFMAESFRERGVPTAAVHSGPTSAPRARSVEDLCNGAIKVLFAVDIFNEGFDLPEIDTVLMLRPTESPVIFLQQLGRGLRLSEDKDHLRVIDFIGNHRSFLQKPRTLLSLGSGNYPTRKALLDAVHEPDALGLPEGCSVTWDLEAIQLFERLLELTGRATNALAEYVLDHVEETGQRPTAVQAFRAGFNVGTATRRSGWFSLLHDLGVLGDDESGAVIALGAVLHQIEKEPLTKAYKLVTLRALIHDEALRTGTTVERVAHVSRRIIGSDPRLTADTDAAGIDIRAVPDAEWEAYWRRNPIAAWTASGKRTGDPLFRLAADRLEPTFGVPEGLGEVFDDLVEELVEYRLARYLARPGADAETMSLRVSHADGRPIIFLDRQRHPETPEGWTGVIADGRRYQLNFVKVAVNVARLDGSEANVLPQLLRGWFGEEAGHPGTEHRVLLRHDSGRWTLSRAGAQQPAAPHKLRLDGLEIDAEAVTRSIDAHTLAVTIESAGGKRGSPSARNLDYVRGVDLILERAGQLGLSLADAYVDSERTRHLTIEERRLIPGDGGYPVRLGGDLAASTVRQRLLQSMGAISRAPDAKSGGNQRKRMTMIFHSANPLGPDTDHDLRHGETDISPQHRVDPTG